MEPIISEELRKKYHDLDNLIQEISKMEGIPENGLVTQWAIVTGIVAFDDETGFMDNDVQVLTPNGGMTTPVWQAKGLLDSGLTKYRALESFRIEDHMDCDCDEEDNE